MTELIDDRYELLEVIASGGMATVWRARDTRLDRLVAVKRPHPAPSADDAVYRRMDREARAAASLNHPNLVTVYDYGRDSGGPFLVMALVDGPTLDEVAAEIEAAEAVEIGIRIAGALEAIHAAGIVHRDVKPANVIMSDRGPLLTDFGIAMGPGETATITAPGKIVTTPSYAAPEVLAGDLPTPAADVYALAVVLAELFTGEPLFTGFDRPQSVPSLGDAHLDWALGPALSADPTQRPTASGLASALEGTAPTLTTPVPVAPATDPTLVMDRPVVADVPPPPPAASAAPSASETGWRWLLAGLLVGVLVFLLATQGPGGDEVPLADASTPGPLATTTTSTLPATSTTTTLATTTTTTIPSTTTTTTVDEVAQARDRFREILLEPPRDDLNEREVDEIMERVDDAVRAAQEGDEEAAADQLGEVSDQVDEKLSGEERRRARDALEELADLLGVRLRSGDDSDEDDDD